jgi:hypothetical protein
LHGQRQVGDFVQKQGAAGGLLEESVASPLSAPVKAPLR